MNKYMVHGGSWDFNRVDARCAYRNWDQPHVGDLNLGFRVIREDPQKRKTIRGGSWYYDRDSAGSSVRDVDHPDDWSFYQGFRVIKDTHNE